ncbi:helix-turn-helix transcriptional regulator [Methylobacterium radiodurans]|uniref:Helix-turn-helix transcriptional regulator n=1 Tax=Methylobacterium radiodurans TaxID=2202828 RepID=A0A2U8VTF7_9HYPH|nr:helix-turn-helix transcriptional regulator [Methylobacterium radiodurans]AWN36741.1 helix-turn-helix transcriptional regulator [Methylobacterium radiodurans]
MESEETVSDLIDRFYEAALRPELWRETLEASARVFGAEGALMLPGPDAPLELACNPFLDAAIADGLARGWLAHNPRVLRGIPAMRDPTRVLTEQHIFTPRELDHMPFHAEYVNAHGLRHFAGLYLVPAGGRSLILSLERAPRSGAFGQGEIDALERVVPHLQRAGRLALRIAEARAGSALEAFDLLRCAGMLLDGAGAVLRMNARAAALMGRGLNVLQGALIAQHGPSNAALGRLIGGAVRAEGRLGPVCRPVAVPRPGGAPPLVVHAAPLPGAAGDLFQQARAVLLIVDPAEAHPPGEALLREIYGLTTAEARLARMLADGRDLGDAADALGVAVSTARTQLKAVFAKTGTRRQAQLAVLLAGLGRGP